MLEAILLGAMLIIATTFIHGACTSAILISLRAMHVGTWVHKNHWTRGAFLAGLVVFLFLTSVLEATVWALVYLRAGVIDGFEKAMYFSVVTFTTLGYGDVTLEQHWRLLGAFQAAAGIIIFGWSTAIIVAAVQKVYFDQYEDD